MAKLNFYVFVQSFVAVMDRFCDGDHVCSLWRFQQQSRALFSE